MAKGFEANKKRNEALGFFMKDLIRRSKAKCELCGASGVSLSVYEVPPIEDDPDFDKCVLTCEECQRQINKPSLMDPNHWRCLNTSIWSEISAVKVLSVSLLKLLAASWAADLIDQVYLDEDEQEWLNLMA